jgi:hypothetical protein
MATKAEQTAKLQASIEAQAKRLAELKAKKARIDAIDRSKEKSEERKKETRRLVLLGVFFKSKMESNDDFRTRTMAGLDVFLTRPEERKLFGLLPLLDPPAQTMQG